MRITSVCKVLTIALYAVDLVNERQVPRQIPVALTTQTWGGVPYYETSARRDINVHNVFEDLLRQVIRHRNDVPNQQREGKRKKPGSRRRCVIL